VLVTLNDKKLGVSSNDSTVDYFNPQVVSAQDYYPFGMLQAGRSYNAGGYRYGFNGKENDNEVKGEGEQQDYGMRVYDPRLGKFLSVDPLQKRFPNESNYVYVSDNPILYADKDGREKIITVTVIDKSGNRAVFKVVNAAYVKFHANYTKLEWPEIPGKSFNFGYKQSVYENYVIDLSNPKNNSHRTDYKTEEKYYTSTGYHVAKAFSWIYGDQSDKSKVGYFLTASGSDMSEGEKLERPAMGSEILDIGKLVAVLEAFNDLYGETGDITDYTSSEYARELYEFTDNLMKAIGKLDEANVIPKVKPKKSMVFVREDQFGSEKKGSVQDHAYTGDSVVALKPATDGSGVDTFHIKQPEVKKKRK
jgi:RHS repeat-associated protein